MNDLPSVLELTLQHNPWRCDCGLRAFRDWMLERDISISYSPNCSAPMRVAGKAWSVLDLDEFACPPDVVRVDTEVVVYEGTFTFVLQHHSTHPSIRLAVITSGLTASDFNSQKISKKIIL